ncbi:MAG: hypothetical protein ABI704_33120 [Kofleriaceae bacterium]
MIEERFGRDSVDARRVLALTHGKRAEDKVLALREGMRANDQKEIEAALESPDLKSADPTKRAKAEAERAAIEKTARAYDVQEQRVGAFMTGKDMKQVQERGVDDQLADHYKSYAETDEHSSNGFEEMRHRANREQERKDREHEAHDQKIASTELSHDGELGTATQYSRADTKGRAKLLDGEQSNKQLATDEADYERKYGKPMLGKGGDRDDMNAEELKIDNVREYGVASERREETELRLQKELATTQHSDSLSQQEKRRELLGGNAGTEDLVREQLAVEDSMLGESKRPFGTGRELKEGVTKDEFVQVDQNLTKSLETQREEKIHLSNHIAHIFSTIAKLGALLAMQPELFVLIDVCSGMAEMAIKKSVAGEAYDPADDAKLLAIDAVVDVATLGAAKLAEARKLGALGKDAVVASKEATVVGDKVATKALKSATEDGVQETAIARAKSEAVEGGAAKTGVSHEGRPSVSQTKSAEAADANAATHAETATNTTKAEAPALEAPPQAASDAKVLEDAHAPTAKAGETAEPATDAAISDAKLETPEKLTNQSEGATTVRKGPHYQQFEAEVEHAEARAAAVETKVKTVRTDGAFEVSSKYNVRTFDAADGKLTEISVDIHLKKGIGVTEADLEKMREHAAKGVDHYYNFKDGKRIHKLADGSNLHVKVNFVNEGDADLIVNVEHRYDPNFGKQRPARSTNQKEWVVQDGSDRMATHEVSHQLGLVDEYEDVALSPGRTVYRDGSLMGQFHDETEAAGFTTEVKPRHIDQISGDIDQARKSEVAASRPTQPMQAVSESTAQDEAKLGSTTQSEVGAAQPIDETKAAAETQKLPAQTDGTNTPPFDEAKAAAETQKIPAQADAAAKLAAGAPKEILEEVKELAQTNRERALKDLVDEAAKANVVIHSDENAQALLDWSAKMNGAPPESFHAVTIGDDIFVRPEFVENVRVLREELIHVFQQRGGIGSNELVEGELQARLSMIQFRYRWGITNDEVREMIREVRKIRETGRY